MSAEFSRLPKDTENSGDNKMPVNYKRYLILFLAFTAVVSCAGNYTVQRNRTIFGFWKNEHDFIISIKDTPKYGVAAFIKFSPGYNSEQFKPGKVVIRNIRPLVDGGFSGIFDIENDKSMKVQMIFSSPDTLLILSWDRRVQGRIMKWSRVKNKEELDFINRQ